DGTRQGEAATVSLIIPVCSATVAGILRGPVRTRLPTLPATGWVTLAGPAGSLATLRLCNPSSQPALRMHCKGRYPAEQGNCGKLFIDFSPLAPWGCAANGVGRFQARGANLPPVCRILYARPS